MKRLQINAAKVLLVSVLAVTLFSCVRKDNFFPSNSPSTRKAVVKILGGGTPANVVPNFIDFVNTSQTVFAIDLRRDPNDQGDLNTSMTVVVQDDTAAVKTANPAYKYMPTSWYNLQSESPKVGGVASGTYAGNGGTFTFLFKPGEFAKQVYIVIPDATVLDPSSTYGLGFTVTSITGAGIIGDSKSLVVTIGAKNAYDGIYEDNFTNYHPSSNPGYTGAVTNVYMITTGGNKCKIYWPDGPGYYNPSILGGNLTAFLSQEPEYTIDPVTNAVTVQNAAAGAVTFYQMASGFNSHYDPATRTIYAKFGYNYDPGPAFNAANTREWTQTLRYLGPR